MFPFCGRLSRNHLFTGNIMFLCMFTSRQRVDTSNTTYIFRPDDRLKSTLFRVAVFGNIADIIQQSCDNIRGACQGLEFLKYLSLLKIKVVRFKLVIDEQLLKLLDVKNVIPFIHVNGQLCCLSALVPLYHYFV